MENSKHKHARAKFAIRLSLAVAVIMLLSKWFAYLLTDSVVIFSDAAESLIHIIATAASAMSLYYSQIPEDANHTYGHGKITFFAAGSEGVLLFTAAAAILYQALSALILGVSLSHLEWGMGITLGLALINLLLGKYLLRVGKDEKEFVLESNGQHVLADVWTSLGAVGGIALVHFTGLTWLDPAVGIVVGILIAFTACKLMNKAFQGLMDYSKPEIALAIQKILDRAIEENLISCYHQLRFRESNKTLQIQVHLLMPGNTTLEEAHCRNNNIEVLLQQELPDFLLAFESHFEPEDHRAAHPHRTEVPGPLDSRRSPIGFRPED